MPIVGGDRPEMLEGAHHAMSEGTPTICVSESLCPWASEPGEAVSGLPGIQRPIYGAQRWRLHVRKPVYEIRQ